MKFEITPEQQARINEWLKNEVFPPIVERQRGTYSEQFHVTDSNGITWPYEGAIGGGLTYSFTPTGLGIIFVVKYGEERLDLTDADNW